MGHGITFLMLITSSGRVDRVEFVLDRGADIDHRDDNGKTAVIYACLKDRTEALALLLNRGADPSVCDNDGRTPLILAANSPHGGLTMIILLRHDKVDIDAVTHAGDSAVKIACVFRNLAAEATLLEAGADPSWWERYALSLPQYIEAAIENELDPRHLQAWYRTYSLVKARYLHDAVTDIRDRPMLAQRVITRSRAQQGRLHSAPACLQQRVRAGGCLPEVELRVPQGEDEEASEGRRGKRGKSLREGSGKSDGGGMENRALGSMVVGYAAAAMSRELFLEMMGWVPITADAEAPPEAQSAARM